ncbi:MAG TPA: VCBS repeat-containing protein [Kofleriaceae bacterium]
MRAPRVLFALFILGAALTACTSFDSIDRNVCGNGIVEAGEDCDSSEASCVRCAVSCQTAVDCPNAAYTCGTDGLCAAPGGELDNRVVAGAFPVDDVTVTDIDRDGIGDVLGVSTTSLSIRFGDSNGRLERAQSVLTPPHIAASAFGDIDGDGATDVAFASADGLIAYGSQFGALAPLQSSKALVDSDTGTPLDLRRTLPLARRAFIGLVDGGNQGAALITFDEYSGFTISTPCQQGPLPVLFSQLELSTLEVYNSSQTDTVLAIRLNTPVPRYCVMAFHLDTTPSMLQDQKWKTTDITPGTLAVGTKKLFLADLDFDNNQNCPGLVNVDQGFKNVKYWGATTTASHCAFAAGGFAALTTAPDTNDPNEVVVGHVELSPGIAFCAHDAIVTSTGVWIYANIFGFTGWGKGYNSLREIAGSTSADLDGDGIVDGVLVAANEDDIDILYRKPNPSNPNFPAFVLNRIDTTNKVTKVAVGDYDGNGHVDLAYVENLGAYERISVAYNHSDFLAPPVQVAAMKAVTDMVAISGVSNEDPYGITSDLFVLLPPNDVQPVSSLAILLGSTLGTMIPVIDPRASDNAAQDQERTRMNSVVIGKFVASTMGKLSDLLLFAPLKSPSATAPSPEVWRLAGTSDGPDGSATPPIATTGFADCSQTMVPGLCVDDAKYLAWPNGTTDAVIAIDHRTPPNAVSFLASAATIAATPLTPVVQALMDKAPVRSLQRADLYGNGTNALIVVASNRGETTLDNAILTCTMDGVVAQACVDVSAQLLEKLASDGTPALECIDAAPAHVQYRDRASADDTTLLGVDLVVACHEEAADGTVGSVLYRVSADGSYTPLARTSTRIGAIRIGDVTGDGVEDVVAVEGDQGVQTLVVFPQCSSRNARACGGGK